MRSESTNAFGQPSDTSPTRGADLGAGLGARPWVLAEDLRACVPAVLCMSALLACACGTRKRLSINAHAPSVRREGLLGRSLRGYGALPTARRTAAGSSLDDFV